MDTQHEKGFDVTGNQKKTAVIHHGLCTQRVSAARTPGYAEALEELERLHKDWRLKLQDKQGVEYNPRERFRGLTLQNLENVIQGSDFSVLNRSVGTWSGKQYNKDNALLFHETYGLFVFDFEKAYKLNRYAHFSPVELCIESHFYYVPLAS